MSQVQTWINDCNKHESCRPSHIRPLFIPSRLLYVGLNDDSDLRIVLGADLNENINKGYLALSHCWGGEIKYKLTATNLNSLKRQIIFDDLPKNFQDAISVTRSLGISYLWIDSLCILQDSIDDWTKESSAMRKVYTNAICVISATASETSNGGCFRQRPSPSPTWSLMASKKTRYFLVTERPSIRTLFQTRVETAPLSRRGWAFQERLLSRRIVHFCSDVVLFECNTIQASEFDHKGSRYEKLPYVVHNGKILDWIHETILTRLLSSAGFNRDNYIDRSASRGIRGALDMLQSIGTASSLTLREEVEFNKRWYELVSAYTEGALTKSTDKLIALSGIAELVQNKAKTPYVAGLWSLVSVELGLLWRVKSPEQKQCTYCAPSWSWASVNGCIDLLPRIDFGDPNFMEDNIILNAKVERILVSNKGKDVVIASSLVDGGLLEITGPVAEVYLSKSRPYRLWLTERRWTTKRHLTFFPDWSVGSLRDAGPAVTDRLLALYVMSIPYLGSKLQAYGLVVRLKREQNGLTEYERIGVFCAKNDLSANGSVQLGQTRRTIRVV
jgi:hypothetical protein